MPASCPPATHKLTRQHRAWIALYTLDAQQCNRAVVLRENDVTEADLTEFFESWFQLRSRLPS